ncbi:potassium transporter [Aerococcus urinaehominis]|uniref:Potassium transporter n=2 Tax=Aerococcus urinaehominis TaxID=128944 RepID=A0A109RHK6_9LACT|nr:potassium transporter [Aerococcus urinaehominis]
MLGSILLSLPVCQLNGVQATYLDHLFIAVSAVCVTGLWTSSIHDTYNIWGQIVMMLLIQTGGLGLMTIISSLYHSLGQKVSLRDEIVTGEALNRSSKFQLGNFLGRIIRYTVIIEGVGMLLLTTFFVPLLGWQQGLFNSLFTAVSAFCNAGFDLLGNDSLIPYQTAGILNWTIMALIVLGGIGFSVWFDITDQIKLHQQNERQKPWRYYLNHLSTHTKLVLTVTGSVILIGAFLFGLVEWQNPATIGQLSVVDKINASFFQTITMRTAGFASIDYSQAHPFSILIFVLTMFIGGGAGGTAGGLKVSTFALTIMLAVRELRQSKYVTFAHHTIPDGLVKTAFVIALFYVALLFSGSALLLLFDPHVPYLYLLFEAISALATVGVSAGLTPDLSTASHFILMALMFIGRIGPMTMFFSLRGRQKRLTDVKYSKADIIIG